MSTRLNLVEQLLDLLWLQGNIQYLQKYNTSQLRRARVQANNRLLAAQLVRD